MNRQKSKKSQNSKVLNYSMSNNKCTPQKAMDMRTRGRPHQLLERQSKLANVILQLATHYSPLPTATFGPDSAFYGHENRAQNQSYNH